MVLEDLKSYDFRSQQELSVPHRFFQGFANASQVKAIMAKDARLNELREAVSRGSERASLKSGRVSFVRRGSSERHTGSRNGSLNPGSSGSLSAGTSTGGDVSPSPRRVQLQGGDVSPSPRRLQGSVIPSPRRCVGSVIAGLRKSDPAARGLTEKEGSRNGTRTLAAGATARRMVPLIRFDTTLIDAFACTPSRMPPPPPSTARRKATYLDQEDSEMGKKLSKLARQLAVQIPCVARPRTPFASPPPSRLHALRRSSR